MAFTYDPAEATVRDVVRGLFQDIDSAAQILQNETIDARLARFGNQEGAAKCGDSYVMFWSQEVVRSKQGSEEFDFAKDRYRAAQVVRDDIRNFGITDPGQNTLAAGSPALPKEATDERLRLIGGICTLAI